MGVSGRGWARVSSVPAVGTGHSREWDTTGQGPVALYPPCCVQPHLVCIPRVPGARAGESTDVPWVQPKEGRCRAGLSETRSSAGAGERLGGTPSSPLGTACAFLGREPREAEPSLHTQGVRHHHHINNERAAPSKLFVPAPARAQNAEEAREPHPKQPWGERRGARMVLRWSFTRPLTRNDKNLPGSRWVLSLLGVWLLGGPCVGAGQPTVSPAPVPSTALCRLPCPPRSAGKAVLAAGEGASLPRAECSVHL